MTSDSQLSTVLVVEDEHSLADLFEMFLESKYTVHTAHDGATALELMSDEVDVVLLDRRMPGISGEEVLKAIRAEGYDCRVAMVTAVTPDVDIIEMGFDEYLTKPVTRTELLETVDQLVELASYDELIQEYYQLISTKATLEVEKDDRYLAENEEYAQLTARMAELKVQLRSTEESLSDVDVRSLIIQGGVQTDTE
ncbi:response regulator [Haladaptatus sp. DJG-WS-42]|uniref:response regulator n=1 Tax=Haladaptatus sp. DJG-WS-42 TaxID=3120516 RepID=UPI0030CC51D5